MHNIIALLTRPVTLPLWVIVCGSISVLSGVIESFREDWLFSLAVCAVFIVGSMLVDLIRDR